MDKEERLSTPNGMSPFERIRRTNAAGAEYWSSRDFAQVLGYTDYRNFAQVIQKARVASFNSGQRIEDHFVDITEMIEIGKGGKRPVKTILMSRYACYLIVQNADPSKEIVALGQTYFAIIWAARSLPPTSFAPRRRRRSSVATWSREESGPTALTSRSGPRSARRFKNWAQRCPKTCRLPRASRSSKPGNESNPRP